MQGREDEVIERPDGLTKTWGDSLFVRQGSNVERTFHIEKIAIDSSRYEEVTTYYFN